MTAVVLSRPHLKLTAHQWAGEATETSKACSEQCILGISFSRQELDGGSQLCADHVSCLQGGMWTRASVDLPSHRELLPASYSPTRIRGSQTAEALQCVRACA